MWTFSYGPREHKDDKEGDDAEEMNGIIPHS